MYGFINGGLATLYKSEFVRDISKFQNCFFLFQIQRSVSSKDTGMGLQTDDNYRDNWELVDCPESLDLFGSRVCWWRHCQTASTGLWLVERTAKRRYFVGHKCLHVSARIMCQLHVSALSFLCLLRFLANKISKSLHLYSGIINAESVTETFTLAWDDVSYCPKRCILVSVLKSFSDSPLSYRVGLYAVMGTSPDR